MAFGLSFGKKKQSINQTTDISKTEVGSQTGSETTAGTRTGTQATTGTTTGTSIGTSATSGTSAQASTTSGQQQQVGTTRGLSSSIVGGFEGAITSLLGQILDPNTGDRAMLTRGMDAMGGFDVDAYVNGTLQQAKAQQGTQLDELLGSVFSRVGGTEGNNSAATLLANRARGDAAANLAGIEAQARANAAGIIRENLGAASQAIQGGGQALLAQLGQILRGAVTETDVSTLTNELANITGTTAGQTQTAESQQQSQDVRTTTTEDLVQAVLSALQQSTTTTGTERTKGTTKESGGGLSLSI